VLVVWRLAAQKGGHDAAGVCVCERERERSGARERVCVYMCVVGRRVGVWVRV